MKISYIFYVIMFAEFCLAFTNINVCFRPHKKFQSISRNMHQDWDENIPYLDSLVKKPDPNIDKLKTIQNNITKYIEEKNKKQDQHLVFATRYNNPIRKATFDKLFLNIHNIRTIYLPNDYDRAIFVLSNNEKFVFYIHNKNEKHLVEKLMNLIKEQAKIIIVCNKSEMTDPFGRLYCDTD